MDDVIGQREWNKLAIGTGRQCTATSRAGERCKRAPIVGGFTCSFHGGNAPQVRQAARDRLLALVDPVLAAFEEVLASWHATRCGACGHPTGDAAPVIRVGQLVLDRSGFHPSLTIEQAPPPNPFADFSEDQLIDRLEQLLAEATATRDRHRAHSAEQLLPLLTEDSYLDETEPEVPIQEPGVLIPTGNATPDECIATNSLQDKDLEEPHDGN
jgi:hypothetical protein